MKKSVLISIIAGVVVFAAVITGVIYSLVAKTDDTNTDTTTTTTTASPHTHIEVIDPAVAATCTEIGLTEGKHCLECGEVLIAQEIIAALGEHNYVNGICSVCADVKVVDVPNDVVINGDNEELANDVIEEIITNEALVDFVIENLPENGSLEILVSEVNVSENTLTELVFVVSPKDEEGNKIENFEEGQGITFRLPLPASVTEAYAIVYHEGVVHGVYEIKTLDGNKYIEIYSENFSEYGVVLHDHSYEAVVTAPTCTVAGYTTYTCACGDTYTGNEVEKLAHTEVVDPAIAATCTATGKTEGKHCSVCNTVIVAQTDVAKLAHTEVIDAAVAPTCTATGLTEGKHCSVCNATIVAQETVGATGHTEVIDPAVAATCTTTGLTQGKHCSVCNTVIVAQQETPNLHYIDENDTVEISVENEINPTCTTSGSYDAVVYCRVCNDEIYRRTVTVAPLGHSEEISEAFEPTCESVGYTEGSYCSRCNETLVEVQEIPKLPHTEVIDAAVAPTCTATGITQGKHCSVCATVIDAQETVAATGHTEVIDAAVAPTCTTTGLTQGKHCSVCNTVIVAQEIVAATGHSSDNVTITSKNCLNKHGQVSYVCDSCSEPIVETIPDITIKFTSAQYNTMWNYYSAKCTVSATGGYGEYQYRFEIYRNISSGSADLVDDYSSTNTIAFESQTALDNVYIKVYVKDSYGNVSWAITQVGSLDIIDQGVVAIPHTEVIDAAVAPTCTETGLTEGKHCSVCNEVILAQTVIETIDCIESNWIIDFESTHTEDGKKHTECIMCETMLNQDIVPSGNKLLKYTLLNNNTYEVSGIGQCKDKDIVIPSEYNGKTVTCIGTGAFGECTSLESITIPKSVTNIDDKAFYWCTSLTSIEIPDSVTNIGSSAFAGCSSLESITLPFVGCSASATSASSSTLFGYIFGTSGYVGGTATRQYYNSRDDSVTYYIPTTLKNVTITGGNLYYGAFSNCSGFTSVTLGDSVTSIGNYAFYNCTSLTSIEIPNSVTNIGSYAFYCCTSLTSINIPDSVTSIGYAAFHSCTSLASIKIPDSVTSIGDGVFYMCKSLTSVMIGNSVTSIGSDAFAGCKSLTSINFEGTVWQWNSIRKEEDWNSNTGSYTIYCTDGEIAKDGTVTYYNNTNPTIAIENVVVSDDRTEVTFDVCIENNPGIMNMLLSMTVNDDVFGFKTAVKGDTLPSSTFTKPGSKVTTSPYNFLFDAMEVTDDDKTDGVLFTVTLTVKDSSAIGNYDIIFSYVEGDIVDENFESVDMQIENGSITLG